MIGIDKVRTLCSKQAQLKSSTLFIRSLNHSSLIATPMAVADRSGTSSSRSMFADGFLERPDLEQYFWTEATVKRLTQALEETKEGRICCLATPSLAHAFFFQHRRTELLLDVDTRFRYLPGFRYFDLRMPASGSSVDDHPMSVIVFDPPFFYIPLEVLFEAVRSITKNKANCKLVVGFLKREEEALLRVFAAFRLKPTKFALEYATVKPNKWRNYTLYSNVDLPGIKRITKP